METQLQTLSKIFTERLFRIPDYQRGYAWGKKELKEFWNDIQQLESDHKHYTGVLTLENVPPDIYNKWEDDRWIIDSRTYSPYFIVDGQQRLTTSIIMIQVILETIESIGSNVKLNFTEINDIRRKFIYDSKDGGISRSYIFGYEKDNPSYEYLKTKIFKEKSSSDSSQETVYTNNLYQAKMFFESQLKDMCLNNIEVLYSKVTQRLLFNIFTITDDVDVCVAFETMNNRGKVLSYLELLKNRLIYLSIKFNDEEYEKRKLRKAINDCWKSIYHNLGKNKDAPLNDDEFLQTHYVIYFGNELFEVISDDSVLSRRVVRPNYVEDLLDKRFIMKNIQANDNSDAFITLKYVYDYVSSLQESVEIWYKMNNPMKSDYTDEVKRWLDKLNRIDNKSLRHVILLSLKNFKSFNNIVEYLRELERYIFLTNLAYCYRQSYYIIESEIIFASNNLIKHVHHMSNYSIDEVDYVKELRSLNNKLSNEKEYLEDIRKRFRRNGYYGWSMIRYFLYEYNLYLQESSKTDREKISWQEYKEEKEDYITIEHIFPKQARNSYWVCIYKKYTQNQRKTLRNSLGNLLPLSRAKNSSLSCKSFPEKVSGCGSTSIGYRYGSYAENEVTLVKEWTPQEILKRGLKLLNFMESRWKLRLGSEQEKKKMLGLEFIK